MDDTLAPSLITTSRYADLAVGYAFPASHFTISSAQVQSYLQATQDAGALYRDSADPGSTVTVPPLAIAALALRAMIATLPLDPGTVHLIQDYTFHEAVSPGTELLIQTTIATKSQRRGMILMTINQKVSTASGTAVISGIATLMMPGADAGARETTPA